MNETDKAQANVTTVQARDLRAINADPGRYSKCKEDGELMTLVAMGLILWRNSGGYEITESGRDVLSALPPAPRSLHFDLSTRPINKRTRPSPASDKTGSNQ